MVSLNARTEPQGDLGPQPWISAAATRAVMAALTADGADARFVGGCVRDALAKRPVQDIDIATPDPPERVIQLLEHAGIKVVPTGIAHGTVTAIVDSNPFEVTTLRRDTETDGRHAKVAFTDDWIADAERRDFTINAMSASPTGAVYDYNDGMSDLAHGRVRFIGRAETRIEEDYLRILRFFRFYGAFGRPPIDRAALAACRMHASELKRLSAERIHKEFLKILLVPDPADILIHMKAAGVLDVILPEAGDIPKVRMLNWLETRAINIEGVGPDAIRRLAALLDADNAETGAFAVAERLKLSNAERMRLIDMAAPTIAVSADLDEEEATRVLRRLGTEWTRDLALLAWAGELTRLARLERGRTDAYIALMELCANWSPPVFPLSGADVLALGLEPGPDIGRLLEKVEEWWENGGYRANRQQCLDRLFREAEAIK
jgi:poly(A) polymerase